MSLACASLVAACSGSTEPVTGAEDSVAAVQLAGPVTDAVVPLTEATKPELEAFIAAAAHAADHRDAGETGTAADCPSWAELSVGELAPLPASPHAEAFQVVWETLLRKHPDPTLACLDWPAVRRIHGFKLAKTTSAAAAYVVINEMLALLGQSHLAATPPAGGIGGGDRGEPVLGPATAPLEVRLIEGAIVVVRSGLDGHDSGLPPGAELISVRGKAVTQILRETELQETATDGHGAGSSSGRPEAGSARSARFALAAARRVRNRLTCPIGGRVQLRYRAPEDVTQDVSQEIELDCIEPEGERISLGNLRNLVTRVDWRRIEGTRVGYLRFNYWMVPMISRVAAGLSALRAQGMDSLIIDLRGNPGGVGAMSIPVGRMLLPEGGHLGALRMRAMTQELKVLPSPDTDAFGGPIIILVDEGSASTSEIFAVGMRDLGRAQIFGGSATAGMALPSLIETLPDGGRLQYVVGDYQSPKGTMAEGEGVVLDVWVKETRAAFARGEDPVLGAAVARLHGGRPREK